MSPEVGAAERDELIATCRAVGDDLALIQAGGGNASIKRDDGAMWIKASGARMREVSRTTGAVAVDLARARSAVRGATSHEAYVAEVGAAAIGERGRPSLETGFHALLGRAVLHTHALHIAALGCVDGGAAALAGVDDCAWVPYATPGLELARAVDHAIERHRAEHDGPPDLVVLERHGLIASAATGAETVRATRVASAAAAAWLAPLAPDAFDRAEPPPALTSWALGLATALGGAAARAVRFNTLVHAATEPERWLTAGPLVPDDVVFGVGDVVAADPSIGPAAWLSTVGPRPPSFAVALRGLGVVVAAPRPALADALEEVLLGHVLIRRLASARGPVSGLPAAAIAALAAMESERHRRAVATVGEGG